MRASSKRTRASKRNGVVCRAPTMFDILMTMAKALILTTVGSIISYSSQLALSPVYGEIPTSLYHTKISAFVVVAAWAARYLPIKPPFDKVRALLPVLAVSVPVIQRTIFGYSDSWGPLWGPIITEGATYYPILFFSVLSAAHLVGPGFLVADGVLLALSIVIFRSAQSLVPRVLRDHIGSSWILTRCGLPNLAGGIYALVSPSFWLLAAAPALFHTALYNTMCVTTPALGETLAASNYTLLARQESNTGYISVIEHNYQNYRVLRCDHSLLGGVWQKPPPGSGYLDQGIKEPIYSIFVTLEAVRLVDPPPKNPKPKALAIGLGVGTAVGGLIAHGVDTDIVELDPVVYRYAKEYFHLRENHTAYLEDAITFVERETGNRDDDRKQYEYILHDVFTGGAVPAGLFTREFLLGLKDLLAQDGVIAINWAGDLKLKAAKSIIETVRTVFNHCRVFREDAPPSGIEWAPVDFTNMVIFCTRSAEAYSFRAPAEADYLNSIARRNFLFPNFEINLDEYFGKSEGFLILSKSNIESLIEWQQQSALGHWKVIRTVLPPLVWENY